VIKRQYAGVVIDQIHPSLDKLFHYTVPENLSDQIQIGVRVQVPFGHRSVQGYVLTLDDETDVPLERIKPIKKLLDPGPALHSSATSLIFWMKKGIPLHVHRSNSLFYSTWTAYEYEEKKTTGSRFRRYRLC
jgi:primosomal protein N'